MRSPFPGMDPYLEQPAIWSSVHSRLIVAIADAIAPQILPKYYVEVETRTYLEVVDRALASELLVGIPDAVVLASSPSRSSYPIVTLESPQETQRLRPQSVQLPSGLEVKERYLEVRELGTDAVITVIELLSPKNKRMGAGRIAYEEKRQTVLESASHLVELDLLRCHKPMAMLGNNTTWDYRVLVSRSEQRPIADLYGFMLQEPIPVVPLPLKPGDAEPPIDLQIILQGVYERAGYGLRLDYHQPVPSPALSATTQRWVDELLMSIRSSGSL